MADRDKVDMDPEIIPLVAEVLRGRQAEWLKGKRWPTRAAIPGRPELERTSDHAQAAPPDDIDQGVFTRETWTPLSLAPHAEKRPRPVRPRALKGIVMRSPTGRLRTNAGRLPGDDQLLRGRLALAADPVVRADAVDPDPREVRPHLRPIVQSIDAIIFAPATKQRPRSLRTRIIVSPPPA